MRPFNDNEKAYIKSITKMKSGSMNDFSIHSYLESTFFTDSNKRALLLDQENKNVLFLINPDAFQNEQLFGQELHEFFEIINLLSYLNENRYISIIPVSNNSNSFLCFYKTADNQRQDRDNKKILNSEGDYFLSNNADNIYDKEDKVILKGINFSEYFNLISNNLLGLIFPSEELINLVNNGFISSEDRKHNQNIKIANKNLCLAWLGIITAWFIGLTGLLQPLINKDFTLIINDQQYDYLLKKKENDLNIENEIFNREKSHNLDSIKTPAGADF